MRRTMLTTKRKPATVGEILVEEFMRPMGLTQAALAEAMGVQRKHVNELCNDRRGVRIRGQILTAGPPASGRHLCPDTTAVETLIGHSHRLTPNHVHLIMTSEAADGSCRTGGENH